MLETSHGVKEVSNNALILFIDETGEEEMRDPNHPIFGLGGILVPSAQYVDNLRHDWAQLKDEHFSSDQPLHACDLPRDLPEPSIAALNDYFSKDFCRFAVTTSIKIDNSTELEVHHIVSSAVINAAKKLAENYSKVDELVIIFEESQRGDALIRKHFNQFVFSVGESKPEIHKFTMPKSAMEPGLEAADFVIHTAGAQSRENAKPDDPRNTSSIRKRKDFEVMFNSLPDKSSFFFITGVKDKEQ